MKIVGLVAVAIFFSFAVLAESEVQYPTEMKVVRPATSGEMLNLGVNAAENFGVWETTTGTQTCPNGTAASDSCTWYNPGGGATCTGGCNPNAWESCRCW
jgi:hypothetical protein